MRTAALVVMALLASCEKAPPEPAPPPRTTAAVAVAASAPEGAWSISPAAEGSGAKRCVRPLPDVPPPAVRPGPDPACPKDPEGGPPMVPIGHVAFPEARSAPKLDVELMLEEKHQERGLMFRKALADDHGMLFAWPRPSVHTFWMHNTCLPLDMLFIDADGYVAGIVENAPTLNDDGRSIDCPVSYVLEVNAGWSRKHGVKPGQRVKIDGVPF